MEAEYEQSTIFSIDILKNYRTSSINFSFAWLVLPLLSEFIIIIVLLFISTIAIAQWLLLRLQGARTFCTPLTCQYHSELMPLPFTYFCYNM
ncbi:unnamed protein product [Meloidogyne enterolobii]|uniref:Uncharacterized protein n=1 Tax=Meloidogyne enterolobii TaxID=390850 RepID=A0ACB1B4E6_MELEN